MSKIWIELVIALTVLPISFYFLWQLLISTKTSKKSSKKLVKKEQTGNKTSIFIPTDKQIKTAIKKAINNINPHKYADFLASRKLLSKYEQKMYNHLVKTLYNSNIFVQVSLSALITTPKGHLNRYQTNFLRNTFIFKYTDFVVYDDKYHKVQAIIELDDSSHLTQEKQQQDKIRDDIFNEAGYGGVIRFRKIPSKKEILSQNLSFKNYKKKPNQNYYLKPLLTKQEQQIYFDLKQEHSKFKVLPKVSANALITNHNAPISKLLKPITNNLIQMAKHQEIQTKVKVNLKQLIKLTKHETRRLFNDQLVDFVIYDDKQHLVQEIILIAPNAYNAKALEQIGYKVSVFE